jgi:hypothetical protein
MMKKLILNSFLNTLMLLGSGCKKDNDDNASGNTNISVQDIEYAGVAQMAIEYWEYDVQSGQDIFIIE